MIGALHIEDKMHQMTGKLLKDSGWSNIFTQAQVLTSGRAQSVLDEHHIKHTRYAHQVFLVSLYLLQQRSYTVYCSSVQGPPESPEMWIQRCRSDNLMFMFWATIMDLELLMCRFSGKKSLDTLPPTQAALYQHTRRAILQATIWSQATSVHMEFPDFQDWG